MKYLQKGGFQNHSLMKLTIMFTLLFLTAFWLTNFAIYFSKMNLSPQSVQDYYLGSEENFTMPKTFQSMLEVTHSHLPMMAMVILLVTHLLIFTPYQFKTKIFFITSGFLLALANEASGWLVRFVDPDFAWLKVVAFFGFQSVLGILLFALTAFVGKNKQNGTKNNHAEETEGANKMTPQGSF